MKANVVIVHDRRLEGNSPTDAIKVDEFTPLNNLLTTLELKANRIGGIDRLAIWCHGLASFRSSNRCNHKSFMGYGLELCAEHLTFSNLARISLLKGLVSKILLYSCGPANTAEVNHLTIGDGRRFCQELAAFSNAVVIASADTQLYTTSAKLDKISFGHWEGSLYEFRPDRSYRRIQ